MSNVWIFALLTALASFCEAQTNKPVPSKDVSTITLKNCGTSKVYDIGGDRVVGGRDAIEGEFPWQASLRYKSTFIKPTHICGATVLNSKWIITAAHCVYKRSVKNFEIELGVYKQSGKSRYQATYQIAKIIPHAKFDRSTFDNDIALIQLKSSISFTKRKGFINGICLPDHKFNVSGTATTSGWGSTVEDGDMADTLQAVEVPIVPQFICEILFEGELTNSMLCAGEPQGGKDTCQGDSGGPLIQRNADGKSTLIGIVSWGIGCARPLLPGIYTSVMTYIDWIVANVQ